MSEPRGAPSATAAHIPRAGLGSPWNRSEGADGALLPCDERRCSPFPLGALVPVAAVCLGLFAVGVSGNVVTVLLIGRYRDMRTTTNLYLGSTAVSDLLILLGLPLDLYRLWRSQPWVLGQLLCRLSLYAGEGCTYATLLHVPALGVKRYLAVCHPLRARVLVTRRRVRARITGLWAVALLSARPIFFLVGVEQDPDVGAVLDPNGTAQLALPHPSPRRHHCCPRSWDPRRCCSAASVGQARHSWARCASCRGSPPPTSSCPSCASASSTGSSGGSCGVAGGRCEARPPRGGRRATGRLSRVLLVVVLVLIVCWLPFHVGRIIYINTEDSRMMHFSQYFNIVALQLFYLSASINPILYNLISKKYRAAAWKLLLGQRPRETSTEVGALRGTQEEAQPATPGTAITDKQQGSRSPAPTLLGLQGKQSLCSPCHL